MSSFVSIADRESKRGGDFECVTCGIANDLPSGDSLFVSSNDAKFEFGVSFDFSESDSGSHMAM